MDNNNFPPRIQIFAMFPSNKVGLFVEDCTNLDTPKIRVALVPTKDGSGEPCEFFIDLTAARVVFGDLGLLGRLLDDCMTKEIEGKNGKIKVFDLYATIGEKGHRSLTITNMQDGIAIKLFKNNGGKSEQRAYLSSFQARTMGQAISAYINQLNLLSLHKPHPNRNGISEDIKDGFVDDYPGDFPG